MYRAYRLRKPNLEDKDDELYDAGRRVFEGYKRGILKELSRYVGPHGTMDARVIEEDWFPAVQADVFLSHSHVDERDALILAGWLKENLNVDAFVDSCVWGYAPELLRSLDDRFCLNREMKTYSYSLRNRSTSHVHMILSVALAKMIDVTECVMLLDTLTGMAPVEVFGTMPDSYSTYSPWIYAELALTRLVRRRSPEEHRKVKRIAKAHHDPFRIQYTPRIDHLVDLNRSDLEKWHRRCRRSPGQPALDLLYEMSPDS